MFMSTVTLKSRITNNNITNLWKSHIHLKSPGTNCNIVWWKIRQIVFVRLSLSTTQDFRIKEKNGANLFIPSKYFIRPFFILGSSKLRRFRIMFIK
jgi:hypothetical protein